MALLSKFVDVTTGHTFGAGSANAGPQYRTVQHSLGTTPDLVRAIVVSVGAATLPPPNVVGIGGNASVSTVMLVGSTLAADTPSDIAFSILSQSFYSMIR